MAVFTIAGLTLTDAIRRRTLVGSLLLGLLVLGLSLLLLLIHTRMRQQYQEGSRGIVWYVMQYQLATGAITSICLFAIRILGSLFAILMASGAISGEIERGLLAVILPKPIHRWQILLGKWIGLNIILIGSVWLWTVMLWASITLQERNPPFATIQQGRTTPILAAGIFLAFYPVVIGTLALTLSTFSQRILGTSLALALTAFSWMDGIFDALSDNFNVESLQLLRHIAGLIVPQGYIAWWVQRAMESFPYEVPRREHMGNSSQCLYEWGQRHWNFHYLDAVYVVLYVLAVLLIGAFIFQRRDV